MKTTVKFGGAEVETVWGLAVTPGELPVAQLTNFGCPIIDGEVQAELTDYGRKFLARFFSRRKATMSVSPEFMAIIKEHPAGSTIDFGGKSWRIYRRSYKLNKLYMKEVI